MRIVVAAGLALAFISGSAAAAAATTAGKPAEGVAPLGDWQVGPVATQAGAFAYCVAEARFSNGQNLVVARSVRDEVNLGVGMPGAHMTKGAGWQVEVTVDGSLKRQRQAVAADPDMLVIANGPDTELYEAITHGSVLTISGPSDTVSFQLKGTSKALNDLRTCTERARNGQPFTPLGRVGDNKPQLPPLLKELLRQAGFTKIDLLPASATPAGHAAANTLWRVGAVTSGISSSRSQPGDTLNSLSDAYVARLEPRCRQEFRVSWDPPENLPTASLRLAAVTCGAAGGTIHIALTFDLGHGGLMQVFFHEAPAAEAAAADHDRNAIADVLRRLANP